MENKEIIKLIAIGLICLLVGYGIGFSSGINWSVNIGLSFLKMKGIDVDVDKEMLQAAILQYKENIGGCLFTNASILNNTRD